MSILEASGRLCRGPDGQRFVELLGQHAPTWLAQMPSLMEAAELDALQRKTAGATQWRMLREMTEALEALTVEQPLVLVIEDLHWSDYSTVEPLATLAWWREAARLLVLGTDRIVEVNIGEHHLKRVKQELQVHGQCEELALDFLSEAAVGDYLARRFGQALPASLRGFIHRHTDGNPLFMVRVTDEIAAELALHFERGRNLPRAVQYLQKSGRARHAALGECGGDHTSDTWNRPGPDAAGRLGA